MTAHRDGRRAVPDGVYEYGMYLRTDKNMENRRVGL